MLWQNATKSCRTLWQEVGLSKRFHNLNCKLNVNVRFTLSGIPVALGDVNIYTHTYVSIEQAGGLLWPQFVPIKAASNSWEVNTGVSHICELVSKLSRLSYYDIHSTTLKCTVIFKFMNHIDEIKLISLLF